MCNIPGCKQKTTLLCNSVNGERRKIFSHLFYVYVSGFLDKTIGYLETLKFILWLCDFGLRFLMARYHTTNYSVLYSSLKQCNAFALRAIAKRFYNTFFYLIILPELCTTVRNFLIANAKRRWFQCSPLHVYRAKKNIYVARTTMQIASKPNVQDPFKIRFADVCLQARFHAVSPATTVMRDASAAGPLSCNQKAFLRNHKRKRG